MLQKSGMRKSYYPHVEETLKQKSVLGLPLRHPSLFFCELRFCEKLSEKSSCLKTRYEPDCNCPIVQTIV